MSKTVPMDTAQTRDRTRDASSSPAVPRRESAPTGRESPVPSLAVDLAGITFVHPILAASGPLGFGRELQSVVDLRSFAGFVTKSVTVEPRQGNPRPQVVPTEAGWLNSVGLANHGLAVFLTKELPFLRTLKIPIIVSMAGETVAEFVTLAEWLSDAGGVDGLEINVSCPNVARGLVFGVDPRLTYEVVHSVRRATALPLFVKLTPNVTDITVIGRAAEDAGADGLSLINTVVGMALDIHTRRPKLGTATGGLSGPAIKPIAVRMVWEVARSCHLPVIGLGGITTADDVVEFLIAGARAVAVGSAAIDRPEIATALREGVSSYLVAHGLTDVKHVIGSVDGAPSGRRVDQ